ncbi:bile acid:sodium symporter family protein [Brevundimonas sp. SORGH_AS_0993]|uniref:bile acid:sodium symporter family protein n=1 Tax=Brevundimonas sp. SORGH_AS_0993 TaxID=3041794 RepID=UPI0027818DDF|nr:bile acid:sodium symporter family protein [Brevundimonas sp. SORGH_AS_0993]MDQ1153641.1 sodium/bile acid cotransporter 7 [Brevundimonas sp. SORGH_AS_0993]
MFSRIRPDGFTLLLAGAVLLATLLPCRGAAAAGFEWATRAAITLLFFMHGAKLSREAVVRGLGAWRLHLGVLTSTFVLFPLLGLMVILVPDAWIGPEVKVGVLFLCVLPSTVQSSIALTAIAGGNVAAAVCSASLSNILGVFLTPLLVGLLIHAQAGQDADIVGAIGNVALTLLAPFLLGHLSRPWTARFVDRHKLFLGRLDRGSILLVVYTAFSAAVIEGIWSRLTVGDFALIAVVDVLLLAAVLVLTTVAARLFGVRVEDEIVLVFCGSKKSLASGVPMAAALFPAAAVGVIIVPLMLFHQLQLIVCAILARRYAERNAAEDATVMLPT